MPTAFDELNQDCLNYIFSYFDIYQLIDIEETCRSFKVTCENVFSCRKYHKIKIELRTLRPEYFERILDRIVPTVRDFGFFGGFIMDVKIKETLVDGLINNCEHLRKLTINYVQFDKELFDRLQNCFDPLIYLDLSHCAINEQSEGLILRNDKTKNLKQLVLAGNANMSGAFFQSIENVEVLDVSYCSNLRYYQFLQFLKNCKCLKSLNATGSPQLMPDDRNIFEDLLLFQSDLEVLLMDFNGVEEDSQILAKFKNLKKSSFSGRKFGT